MTRTVPRLALSESEAAAALGMSVATFRRLRKAAHLPPPVLIGDVPRWPLATLQAVLDGSAARPEPARFEP